MLGAVFGDVAGSLYEFNTIKTKEFPLFSPGCRFTDDSVMTLAVFEVVKDPDIIERTDGEVRSLFTSSMRTWGRRYPRVGYGERFSHWLLSDMQGGYWSYANGAAMRVSPVSWAFETERETLRFARLSAEVSHNHPDAVKGAQSAALAGFMARKGAEKEEIRDRMQKEYGYDLAQTLDVIRGGYTFELACLDTVEKALIAFLESTDFCDAVRNAVSLGGDSDTIGAVCGGIAEAYYGIPEKWTERLRAFLNKDFDEIALYKNS